MGWKKYSWVFSLLVLIVLATLAANIEKLLGSTISGKAAYNFTNNPNGIVVEEFSDFACPFCGRVRTDLYAVLNKHNGKVNFIFRHLIVHPETQTGAEASECARDQGKFIEYADMLYNSQDFSFQSLMEYAQELGLDIDIFEKCLLSGEKTAVIQRDYDDAMARGVMGTPSFFVDGQQVSIEYLDLAIEERLNVHTQS